MCARTIIITASLTIIYALISLSTAHRNSASRYATTLSAHPRSQLRTRMKQVLHLKDDTFLQSMFDLENPDPTYIFIIPDTRNRTVVFKQGDFLRMDYPNVTTVGRSTAPLLIRSSANSTSTLQDDSSNATALAQRWTMKGVDYYNDEDYSDDDDVSLEDLNKVVAENVRTERNFIEYIEDLNESSARRRGKARKFNYYGNAKDRHVFPVSSELFSTAEPHRTDERKFNVDRKQPVTTLKRKAVTYDNVGEVYLPPLTQSPHHRQHHHHDDESEELDGDEEYVNSYAVVPLPRIKPKLKSATVTATARHRPKPQVSKQDHYRPSSNVLESRQQADGGWDDLGLDGWSGGLSEVMHEFEEKPERPPTSDIFAENGMTYEGMKDLFNTRQKGQTFQRTPVHQHPSPRRPIGATASLSPHHQTHRPTGGTAEYHNTADFESNDYGEPNDDAEYVPPKSRAPSAYQEPALQQDNNESENWADANGENQEYVYMINGRPISMELAELLQDDHGPLNLTRHLHYSSKQKFSIARSRKQHKDTDVFVARANNPFGYSTKWKWRNETHSQYQRTRDSRKKRGVVQLYSMLKCATGCDPIIYKGYGCYCGFLGQGQPLDGIDRCCKMHDACYLRSACPQFLEYFVPYLWKCYKGQPLCAIDHGEWGGPDSCAARLCQCDLQLSMCLRRYYCPRKRNVCTSSPWRLLQNLIMDF